jgi:hypothetical protein
MLAKLKVLEAVDDHATLVLRDVDVNTGVQTQHIKISSLALIKGLKVGDKVIVRLDVEP